MAKNYSHIETLTSGRVIFNNAVLNFIGQTVPMLTALFTIPILLARLGIERFGILNLVWMAIGYFTFFDLGLGRAVTKLVAEKIGNRKEHQLSSIIWTATSMMILFGIFSMIIMLFLSPWLSGKLKGPIALYDETVKTFYLLSLSVPIITTTSALRGVLEALQRFDLTTYIRVPMGILTFLAPVLVLPFTTSLFWITASLVIVRILAWLAHVVLCMVVLPSLRKAMPIKRDLIKPLLKFGGWMTVSNIISPVMVSADRFIIGSLVSVSAVSFYSTPWEVVTKILLIPASIIGVLFPAFSASHSSDPRRTQELFSSAIKYTVLLLLPIVLFVILFAKRGITIWLGSDFAGNSYRVMQILAIGVFFNGLGYLPFGLIQGLGRPDLTAKFHVVEVLFYLPSIFILVSHFGITGAAVSWSLRAALDTLLLYIVSAKMLAKKHPI